MIFFPVIGTRIRLLDEWTFTLFDEDRNLKLFDALGYKSTSTHGRYPAYDLPYKTAYGNSHDIVTLPERTVLKVDRIYVRKGAGDFDSITFYVESCPLFKSKPRFWAKLTDINGKMNGEILPALPEKPKKPKVTRTYPIYWEPTHHVAMRSNATQSGWELIKQRFTEFSQLQNFIDSQPNPDDFMIVELPFYQGLRL